MVTRTQGVLVLSNLNRRRKRREKKKTKNKKKRLNKKKKHNKKKKNERRSRTRKRTRTRTRTRRVSEGRTIYTYMVNRLRTMLVKEDAPGMAGCSTERKSTLGNQGGIRRNQDGIRVK
jgi:hypothetical protein